MKSLSSPGRPYQSLMPGVQRAASPSEYSNRDDVEMGHACTFPPKPAVAHAEQQKTIPQLLYSGGDVAEVGPMPRERKDKSDAATIELLMSATTVRGLRVWMIFLLVVVICLLVVGLAVYFLGQTVFVPLRANAEHTATYVANNMVVQLKVLRYELMSLVSKTEQLHGLALQRLVCPGFVGGLLEFAKYNASTGARIGSPLSCRSTMTLPESFVSDAESALRHPNKLIHSFNFFVRSDLALGILQPLCFF